jgi:hypothetical protein
VCLQVIGRVRGAAAVRVTTSVAVLAVAEAAGGGSAGHAHALTDSSAEAAAAALLASPRHRLRTPRARVTDQQVELAVVGPGDIIGEADRPDSHILRAPVNGRSLCECCQHLLRQQELEPGAPTTYVQRAWVTSAHAHSMLPKH